MEDGGGGTREPKEEGLDVRKRKEADLQMTERETEVTQSSLSDSRVPVAATAHTIGPSAVNRRNETAERDPSIPIRVSLFFTPLPPFHSWSQLARNGAADTQMDVADNMSRSKSGQGPVEGRQSDRPLIAF